MKNNKNMEGTFDIVVNSPGRINIIGEHTDYNNGFVLPTAIDKKIRFKFRKNGSPSHCEVQSLDFDKGFTFDLKKTAKSAIQWENYILGVVYEIQQLATGLQGFDCVLESDIPIGSGVSSSAALECGLAFGLNELFTLKLTKLQLVELSQRAEHNYVGTKCGIMDQYASVMSKEGHVILLDCQSLEATYVPMEIAPYKLVLLNTNVSHNLASGAYNIRRQQCEEGVAVIQHKYTEVQSLRDVSMEMLSEFKVALSAVVYDRCLYVVQENERTLNAVEALKNNDLKALGAFMYQTHTGLQQLYEVSCKELDFLVDFSRKYDEVLGARVMGGGFGGCTINLIHKDAIDGFIKEVSEGYLKAFGIKLTSFEAMPCGGTRIEN
ncbi:MAG: galactokinase [Flavobacteriaceae bacterium]|nr:galactokinase [Flavobacteriaceae bacterium]